MTIEKWIRQNQPATGNGNQSDPDIEDVLTARLISAGAQEVADILATAKNKTKPNNNRITNIDSFLTCLDFLIFLEKRSVEGLDPTLLTSDVIAYAVQLYDQCYLDWIKAGKPADPKADPNS